MNFARDARPLLIGHRGASAVAPENTLESFEAAVAAGADAIEFDVGKDLVVAHSERELPESPLSLDEALDFVRRSEIAVLVDLKQPGIEREVVAAVRRHRLLDRAFVSSTSARALRRVTAFDSELTCSITYPNDRFRISRLSWPGAGVLTLHHALLSPAVVRAARTRGVPVVAWTVNDPDRIAALARLDVDGIVTDDPEGARKALATLHAL